MPRNCQAPWRSTPSSWPWAVVTIIGSSSPATAGPVTLSPVRRGTGAGAGVARGVMDTPAAAPPSGEGAAPTGPRPVLVLGATGYIGRRLVSELVAGGHRVRA